MIFYPSVLVVTILISLGQQLALVTAMLPLMIVRLRKKEAARFAIDRKS